MATTRLKIYNGALRLCSERAIASLTVNEEGRRLLDEIWNDGGVRYCLEQGQWRFAMKAAKMTPDTSVTPDFGLANAYAKPSDWCVTSAVCQDEFYNVPLLRYTDEAGYWFADINPIYVKFVSDSESFGSNLALWPVSFTEYVKAYFAGQIIGKLSADQEKRDLILKPRTGLLSQALLVAKNRDAMAEPTKFPAQGRWTRARQGGRNSGWNDGGNRGSLIG